MKYSFGFILYGVTGMVVGLGMALESILNNGIEYGIGFITGSMLIVIAGVISKRIK